MFKKLTLLILMVFSLNFYTQVVIKDEIILYETENPDEETLTMPFYGRVTGSVNSGAIVNGYFRKVVIEAGGQIVVKQCPCGSFCQFISHGWAINNLADLTPVNVTVYSHCVNGQFVEADTRLVNTGTHQYKIEFFNPNHQRWYLATTLKFITSTPITCNEPCGDCPELPECDYYDDYPTFTFEPQEDGFNNTYACTSSVCPPDPEKEKQLAGFIPVSDWDLLDGYTWNLYICSDPATGNVNFRYSVDYEGQTINSIPIPYIIAHCDDSGCDPTKIHIEDIDDFVDKLKFPLGNPVIHLEDYCNLLDDICNHWGSYPQPNYRFLLTELTDFHEEQHLNDYKEVINSLKEKEFYPFIKKIEELCSIYQSNQQGVINEANETMKKIIDSFIRKAIDIYNKKPNRDSEIQNLTEMGKKAYAYYKKFRSLQLLGVQYGGIPNDNCPPILSCNHLIDFINNQEERR